MALLVDPKKANSAQVKAVASANVRNSQHRRVATSAAKYRAHPVPVKHQFADRFHRSAARAGRFRARHLKRKNLVQQSARGVAVQSQIAVLHIGQPPVGPKRSVLIRAGS